MLSCSWNLAAYQSLRQSCMSDQETLSSESYCTDTLTVNDCIVDVVLEWNRELWDGPRAGTEGALEFLGVDEVSSCN